MSDLLLERSAELAAIDRALRVALAGHARQLLICGPPGSGRTALLEYARARAHGLNVLAAAGEHGEQEFPFALARRLLEPDEVVSTDRYGLQLELNRVLAAKTPALIVIDDLQWCDPDSLRWLAFAARRLRRTGLALVAASDSPTTGFHGATMLRLRPFSARAVETLLHVELGHAVDARFAAACHRETGGRPLLVHEVAVAARRNRVHETGGAEQWVASVVPPGVGRFLERRLATLPPAARALAGAVALLDAPAASHEAAALAGLGPDAAAAASDRLQHAGLLDDWTIAPPLLARVLYDALPPARRARMHAHAARFGSAERHLLYSEPSADPWVVDMLRRAAEQALEQGQPGQAAGLLRRAVREGVLDARAPLMLELARVEQRLASRREIGDLQAAVEHGAPRVAVEGALARALLAHGRTQEALALAHADVAELHAGARLLPGAGAITSARLAAAGGGTPALLACRAAEAVCAASSAETAVALARRALANTPATTPWSSRTTNGAAGPPTRCGGLDPESPAFFLACAALAWSDQLSLAREHLEGALARARRLGSVAGLARAETGLAAVALRAGDVEAAVVHATTALGAGRGTALAAPARAVLVMAFLELDRPDDAATVCDAGTPEVRFARGLLRLVRCEPDAALDDLLTVGRLLAADHIEGPAVIPWRSAAALAFPPDAQALAWEEHALAVRFGAPRAIGRALRALAAVGPASERTTRCRAAVAALEGSEARLEYAHALCDLGASLRRERQRRDAREPLREALDLAVRCGATALARRAREELAATGARPRRLAQSGRDALTPAELRVARLAARGLANRQIAQTLVVTVKTVETELGHAYAKLGIRSRRELPGVLEAAG